MSLRPNLWPTLSRPLDAPRLRALSFGAGVQSTTLALMALHGEIGPMPDCAIFADTEDEPVHVYEHLAWIQSPNVALPFPIVTVSAGSIRDQLLGGEKMHGRPPLFIAQKGGKRGRLNRQCTSEWKIRPIEQEVRRQLGLKPRQRWPKQAVVEQWIGISTDEVQRMAPGPRDATYNRYPLIEIGFSRNDCERWLLKNGYPVPAKSACRVCPFRSNREWRQLSAEDFAAAVEVDRSLRSDRTIAELRGTAYLHPSLRPLDEVDLGDPMASEWTLGFEEVCGGGCGS
jgi:hypothetical protein